MSIQIMTAVWKIEGLTTGQKMVLLSLADNANDDGVCYPSIPQIAKRCSQSEGGTIKIIKFLEKSGYLSKTTRPGKKTWYRLTIERGKPLTSDDPSPEMTPHLRCSNPSPEMTTPTTPIKNNRQEPSLVRARAREGTGEKKKSFTLPDWIPPQDWDEYEEMRRLIRKPMTNGAREKAVRRLDTLRGQGHDPSSVLQQSVFNSWQGLFAIKHDRLETGGQGNRQPIPQKKHVINLIERHNV